MCGPKTGCPYGCLVHSPLVTSNSLSPGICSPHRGNRDLASWKQDGIVYRKQFQPFYSLKSQADSTHQQESREHLILLLYPNSKNTHWLPPLHYTTRNLLFPTAQVAKISLFPLSWWDRPRTIKKHFHMWTNICPPPIAYCQLHLNVQLNELFSLRVWLILVDKTFDSF